MRLRERPRDQRIYTTVGLKKKRIGCLQKNCPVRHQGKARTESLEDYGDHMGEQWEPTALRQLRGMMVKKKDSGRKRVSPPVATRTTMEMRNRGHSRMQRNIRQLGKGVARRK